MTTALLVVFARPSFAEVCDLTETSGNLSCDIVGTNGAGGSATGWFFVDETHPTGTGVFQPFLRLQQKGTEEGYNTTARSYSPGGSTQFDEKTDPNWTRNLLLSNVGQVDLFGNGTLYRQFILDLNEPNAAVGSKHLITLDQLEIYVSNNASLDKYTPTNGGNNDGGGGLSYKSGAASTAVKIFDMDTGSGGTALDQYIQLDYRVTGGGSGTSDMAFYLPSSLFGNYTYVYLYSEFGQPTGSSGKYASEAGFEEWSSRAGVLPPPNTAVPEPATLTLLGTGILAATRRKFRRA